MGCFLRQGAVAQFAEVAANFSEPSGHSAMSPMCVSDERSGFLEILGGRWFGRPPHPASASVTSQKTKEIERVWGSRASAGVAVTEYHRPGSLTNSVSLAVWEVRVTAVLVPGEAAVLGLQMAFSVCLCIPGVSSSPCKGPSPTELGPHP